jgi:hypothetical protein
VAVRSSRRFDNIFIFLLLSASADCERRAYVGALSATSARP